MSSSSVLVDNAASPLAWVGRRVVGSVTYLGGLALIVLGAARTASRLGPFSRGFRSSVSAEVAWMLAMGLPLVAIIHVGLGSFLAMQAYYGGTFLDGTGAIVGVGLFRNVAPQMACFVLAGLLAARVTPETRARAASRDDEARPRPGFLERTAEGVGVESAGPGEVSLDRMVASRLAAAVLAGPVLSLWGGVVGTGVGWLVGRTMMGVSSNNFFFMFWEMLWARDAVGLVAKGCAFGLAASALACQEGVCSCDNAGPNASANAACRAACFSAIAILFLNSGWFLLAYHAGPAFGPTLLTPPNT